METSPPVVKVVQTFMEDNKLSLELGDTVIVIDGNPENNWWRGQNQRTFDIGDFPRKYVQNVAGKKAKDISKPLKNSFIHTGHGSLRGTKTWGSPIQIDDVYLRNPMTPPDMQNGNSPNTSNESQNDGKRGRVLTGRIMRTPNDASKAPSVAQQPQETQQRQPVKPAPPIPVQPNQQNKGKYDESILFQLQRAPPGSTMSSIRSSVLMPGTHSQHKKEDSLIDLNEESSYLRPSQPEPDIRRERPVYMNQNKQNNPPNYQRIPPPPQLTVSDQPIQNQQAETDVNHQRIPSDSSILDQPIDVPEQDQDFAQSTANFDDRTYANFPSNLDQYADQSMVDNAAISRNLDENGDFQTDEFPLASSTVIASGNGNADSSFDSLPPGEKYHLPPNDVSNSSNEDFTQNNLHMQRHEDFIHADNQKNEEFVRDNQENEENEENFPHQSSEELDEDPFDTSGIFQVFFL